MRLLHGDGVKAGDLLSRLSLFRWRLEWLLLLVAAASLVVGEQAREARHKEPAVLALEGQSARAHVLAARELQFRVRIPRGEIQEVVQTYVDLEWRDNRGQTRRVADVRIASDLAADLGIDPPRGRWPEYVEILYMSHAVTLPALASAPPLDDGVAGLQRPLGPPCRPRANCSLAVLDRARRSSAHEELERISLALAYAPIILWLSIVAFAGLIGLRLAGIVHNEPTLS